MSTFNPAETGCVKVCGLLDSYVTGEMDETRAEVRRHLETCGACNALVSERERLRVLVRRAVRSEPAPAGLRLKVQEMIRRDAR